MPAMPAMQKFIRPQLQRGHFLHQRRMIPSLPSLAMVMRTRTRQSNARGDSRATIIPLGGGIRYISTGSTNSTNGTGEKKDDRMDEDAHESPCTRIGRRMGRIVVDMALLVAGGGLVFLVLYRIGVRDQTEQAKTSTQIPSWIEEAHGDPEYEAFALRVAHQMRPEVATLTAALVDLQQLPDEPSPSPSRQGDDKTPIVTNHQCQVPWCAFQRKHGSVRRLAWSMHSPVSESGVVRKHLWVCTGCQCSIIPALTIISENFLRVLGFPPIIMAPVCSTCQHTVCECKRPVECTTLDTKLFFAKTSIDTHMQTVQAVQSASVATECTCPESKIVGICICDRDETKLTVEAVQPVLPVMRASSAAGTGCMMCPGTDICACDDSVHDRKLTTRYASAFETKVAFFTSANRKWIQNYKEWKVTSIANRSTTILNRSTTILAASQMLPPATATAAPSSSSE